MIFSIRSLPSAALAVVMGISLASVASTANAAGKGKGPQAGVAVQTTCALNGTQLSINVRVDNKSNGEAVPYVSGYSITPTYKSLSQKGNATTSLNSEAAIGSPNEEVATSVSYSNTVDLCNIYLDQLPTDLRALNAETTVDFYGVANGVVTNEGSITNSCKDDPATEAVEPAGIKINWYDIQAACNP